MIRMDDIRVGPPGQGTTFPASAAALLTQARDTLADLHGRRDRGGIADGINQSSEADLALEALAWLQFGGTWPAVVGSLELPAADLVTPSGFRLDVKCRHGRTVGCVYKENHEKHERDKDIDGYLWGRAILSPDGDSYRAEWDGWAWYISMRWDGSLKRPGYRCPESELLPVSDLLV